MTSSQAVLIKDQGPEEAEHRAVEIALGGGWLRRRLFALRSLHQLGRNPGDTEKALLVGIALNGPKTIELVGRFASWPGGLRLLTERPGIDSRNVDYDALRALPDGTLGREYVRFLDDHDLSADLFRAPPGMPEVPAYVAQRLRQSHDIWHVVTGYGTTVPDEIALQAFTYGQTDLPSARALSRLGLLRWGWRYPSLFRAVRRAYSRGKNAAPLATVAWEDLWDVPLGEVRRRLGVQPGSEAMPRSA